MQKKVLWVSIIILIIILVVLFFVLMPKKANTPIVQTCEPYLNISAISKTGDTKSCDCLKDAVQIKQCQENISNVTTYDNALNQANVSACNKISSAEVKQACINVIQEQINYAAKNINLSTTSTNKIK